MNKQEFVGVTIMNRNGGIKFQSTKATFKEAAQEGGADLMNANLSGADLSGICLLNAKLSGADFSGSDLRYTSFCGSDLSNARFCGADLSEADFSGADLRGTDFRDADLSDSHLNGANIRDANFRDADLENARFSGKGGKQKLTKAQLPDFLNALGFQIEEWWYKHVAETRENQTDMPPGIYGHKKKARLVSKRNVTAVFYGINGIVF